MTLPGPTRFDARLSPGDCMVLLVLCGVLAGFVLWHGGLARFELGRQCRTDAHRIVIARDWVNPNTDSPPSLQRLGGIGPSRAQGIVEHRSRGELFKRPQDLLAVHGIGPSTVEGIAPYLRFDE